MFNKNNGFTLIEILVALMIFAIMGVLAAMSLHTIIRAHNSLKKSDHQLLQLQVAMTLLRRDISEVIDRPVREADGGKVSAFVGSTSQITFTRTGLVNPFHLNRQSNMQRVGYEYVNNQLVRLTWDVLDQPPRDKPELQPLLSGVQSLSWQFIAENGSKSSIWPPPASPNPQSENQSPLPKVVLVVMRIKNEGVLQGVFPIPARGIYAKKTH